MRVAHIARRRQDEVPCALRYALRERIADLDAKIRQGNHNLTILPADVLAGVVANVRELQQERKAAAEKLTELEAVTPPAEELEGWFAKIEDCLWNLGELINRSEPVPLRVALRELVRRKARVYTRTTLVGGTVYVRRGAVDVDCESLNLNIEEGRTGCTSRSAASRS